MNSRSVNRQSLLSSTQIEMALERTASAQASESLVKALDDIDQEFQEARLTSVYLFKKLRDDAAASQQEEKGLIPSIFETIDHHVDALGHLPESSEKRRIYQQLERLRQLEESSISARNFVEHALASSNEHTTRQRAKKTDTADAKDQLRDCEWHLTSCFDETTAASIRSRALQHAQAIRFQKIPSAAATHSVAEVEAYVQQCLQFVERHFCLAVEESLKLFDTCHKRAQSHYDQTSEKFDSVSQGETASRRKTRCNLWGLDARAKKMGRACVFLKSFEVDPELLAEQPESSPLPSEAMRLGTQAANAPDGWDGFAKDSACGLNPHRFGL
jgi:hypothetical protein